MTEESHITPLAADSTAGSDVCFDLRSAPGETFFTARYPQIPPDLPYGSYGVAGDPLPYTIRGDDALTIALLLSFALLTVSLSRSRHSLSRQLKNFFRRPGGDAGHTGDDGGHGPLLPLALVCVLLLAISSTLVITDALPTDVTELTGIMPVAIAFAALAVFHCLKWLVGTLVNMVFFGAEKNLQWLLLQLQISALGALTLFPLVALQMYFGFSTENALFYAGVVLILNKTLTFYKTCQIFFQEKGFCLQTFLYFCALEIVPMLALGGAVLAMADTLKVNF